MIFILIASIALGLGAAGLVWGLGRLTGRRPPRFLAPVAGGLAMFAFMLWNEYSWFERSRAMLPEGAAVAESYDYSSLVQPWTLAVPRVARFAAVEVSGTPWPERPALLLGAVTLHARFEPAARIPHLFDCEGLRRAALTPAEWAAFERGAPPEPAALAWAAAGPDDALTSTACTNRGTN
ncbi:hypothetical protein LNKW23_02480 [Paralimibaculum aggregatum]|uniref:Uncharacterized protein n=1 Tax=Paralimibaculum aggregatum TaxID=3036245 RepID=A0ABQ6LKW4_9RHOB|nr:hypothetical protein [Limibaculum sp. NKW23]GMG81036.1 hypothetical protein LNKW23_02480 [Limibaculum sp. NKW23]